MADRSIVHDMFAYLDGGLSREEEQDLAVHIRNDDKARQLYGRLIRMHGNVPDIITDIETSLAVREAEGRGQTVSRILSAAVQILSLPRAAMSSLSGALIRGLIVLRHIIPSVKEGKLDIRNPSWWAVSAAVHAIILAAAGMYMIFTAETGNEQAVVRVGFQTVKTGEYARQNVYGLRSTSFSMPDQPPRIMVQETGLEDILEFKTPEDISREYISEVLRSSLLGEDLNIEDLFIPVPRVTFKTVFQTRFGTGRRTALSHYGGSGATESAVMAALRWFSRHQAPDGSWSFSEYTHQCKKNIPCRATGAYAAHGGLDEQTMTNCATGCALLCFLGAGQTDRTGQFRKQVANGIRYLEAGRKKDGSFAQNNYVHAICTMAAAEYYGITGSSRFRGIAQKAVDIIIDRQTKMGGWDYKKPKNRSDTSITGWQIMALKSAQLSGLDIKDAFSKVGKYMDRVTPGLLKSSVELVLKDHVAYACTEKRLDTARNNPRLTAVGCMVRAFAGGDPGSPLLRAHGNMLLKELPSVRKTDYYLAYYGTLAMFSLGGKYWEQWNRSIKDVILKKQIREGCADGSWDPFEAGKYGSVRAGRVFTTAMACLSLETYYRYPPVSINNR